MCSNSNGSLESAGRTDSVDQSQSDTGEVFLPGFMCISYEDILRDLPLFPGQYFFECVNDSVMYDRAVLFFGNYSSVDWEMMSWTRFFLR